MGKVSYIIAGVLLSLVIVPIAVAYQDDLYLLFQKWLSNEPKAMNKLMIYVPNVPNAFRCYLLVKVFPTPHEPTNGKPKTLYKGAVSPGQVVVVKHVFDAIPVSLRYVNGEYKVRYYEPKEYGIYMLCIDRNKHTVYRFGRIYQVVPTKLINVIEIRPEVKYGIQTSVANLRNSAIIKTSNDADYISQCTWFDYDKCIAWIAFTYINSIPGIRTYFKILGGPIPSAMYIEAFSREYTDLESPPPFSSAGKKLVASVVTQSTDYVSDGERGKVLLNVVFEDDQDWFCDGFVGLCVCFESFYPIEVRGTKLDENYAGHYEEPATPPSYATGPIKGSIDVYFANPGEVKETDEVTGVKTSLTLYESVTVTVDIYKAVRRDNEYTTPYVHIEDISGKSYYWYYWWYKDNDKKTYEVRLYG